VFGFILLLLLFIYVAGVEPSPLLLRPCIGLLYQPWVTDGDVCGAISGMSEWQEKLNYSQETYPSAALSTTGLTWFDPSWNWGHRGGKPATNRLNYGMAILVTSLRLPSSSCM
jgi:hypothetical protein